VQILFIEEHSWDAWDIEFFEKCVLMDFISADFDGFRVVNYLFTQLPSSFRNNVGREQGVGGCTNENSVVVGDVFYVFSEQETEFVPIFLCRAFEIGESPFLSWVTKIIFFNKTCDL